MVPSTRAGYAIASLLIGVFVPILYFANHNVGRAVGIIGLALAVVALIYIRDGRQTGRGMAVTGLVMGIFWSLLAVGNWAAADKTPTATAATSYPYVSAPVARTPIAMAPAQPPTVISVTALGDDFESNQVAAGAKWGGKYVQFTAPVGNIKSDSVSFTKVTSKFSFTQVVCRTGDEAAIVKLVKDKAATVRGVVDGDQTLGVISLNNCEIVG